MSALRLALRDQDQNLRLKGATMKSLVMSAILFAFSLGTAVSHEVTVGNLIIYHPWARASSGEGGNSAVYLTISSTGTGSDRLLAAATPAAEQALLHSPSVRDNVVRMQAVDAVEIAPGEPTVLRPGGVHIMLLGLRQKLQEYDTFPLTLVFEHDVPSQ